MTMAMRASPRRKEGEMESFFKIRISPKQKEMMMKVMVTA